jgi:hypothetical protein
MPHPKFIQIVSAQWEGSKGMTYNLIALSEKGNVYQFSKHGGWTELDKAETQFTSYSKPERKTQVSSSIDDDDVPF